MRVFAISSAGTVALMFPKFREARNKDKKRALNALQEIPLFGGVLVAIPDNSMLELAALERAKEKIQAAIDLVNASKPKS